MVPAEPINCLVIDTVPWQTPGFSCRGSSPSDQLLGIPSGLPAPPQPPEDHLLEQWTQVYSGYGLEWALAYIQLYCFHFKT